MPRLVGSNSQYPKILCTERSTRSQLFARSAYLRYIVKISSRPRIAFSSFSSRLVASFSNFATRISNPQSLTSCHFDINSSGTSSMVIGSRFMVKGSRFMANAALTTSLVCGTFSPRNSSPSPYSPGPVLKNPMSIRRCSSFCSDSIYAMISLERMFFITTPLERIDRYNDLFHFVSSAGTLIFLRYPIPVT